MAETRLQAIWEAVRRELSDRGDMINRADNLTQVSIVLDLDTGTGVVKSVRWSDQRAHRRSQKEQQ